MKVTYKKTEYQIPDAHPAANCLPWHLDKIEFAQLIESVKAGFDDDKPVVVQADTELIISGRRRALACVIAGVVPVTREVDWDDEKIVEWVKRDELVRRNLTPEQHAAALVSLNALNMRGANLNENKGSTDVSADTSSGKTRQNIADEAGVGKATVERLAKLKRSAPELLDSVKEKNLPVNTAVRAAEELTPRQIKKIANSDDPKAEAKKLLGPEKKPAKPAEKPNPFPFGANAPDAEPEVVEPAEPEDLGKAFVAELEDTCREIDRLKARIEAWKGNPFAYTTHWQSHAANLESVRKSIWQGRPCHVCPYCDGEKCDACKQTGRVQKSTYKSGCEAMGKDAA